MGALCGALRRKIPLRGFNRALYERQFLTVTQACRDMLAVSHLRIFLSALLRTFSLIECYQYKRIFRLCVAEYNSSDSPHGGRNKYPSATQTVEAVNFNCVYASVDKAKGTAGSFRNYVFVGSSPTTCTNVR